MGIAVIDYSEHPEYVYSEIFGVEKGIDETYQEYRLRLLPEFSVKAKALIWRYAPDIVVSEIIPVAGLAANSAQRQQAAAATTIFQTTAEMLGVPCQIIAANTVKKILTGNGKATKVMVRNAVISVWPDLKEKLMTNKTNSDEADALAVAIAFGRKNVRQET